MSWEEWNGSGLPNPLCRTRLPSDPRSRGGGERDGPWPPPFTPHRRPPFPPQPHSPEPQLPTLRKPLKTKRWLTRQRPTLRRERPASPSASRTLRPAWLVRGEGGSGRFCACKRPGRPRRQTIDGQTGSTLGGCLREPGRKRPANPRAVRGESRPQKHVFDDSMRKTLKQLLKHYEQKSKTTLKTL